MKKILVAEDNPSNRELFREILVRWGYEVMEAADGEIAIRMMNEMKPDLVLLDIQMPILDGFLVLKNIREDARLARTPVMALTAFAMHGDRERTLAAGFDGYHSKPINIEILKKDIEELLRKAG